MVVLAIGHLFRGWDRDSVKKYSQLSKAPDIMSPLAKAHGMALFSESGLGISNILYPLL